MASPCWAREPERAIDWPMRMSALVGIGALANAKTTLAKSDDAAALRACGERKTILCCMTVDPDVKLLHILRTIRRQL